MIIDIKAKFSCDKCGRVFMVEIDPASKIDPDWSVFELAEDCVRGSVGYDIPDDHFCSVLNRQHLCGKCTEEMDKDIESPVYN